MKTAQEKLWEAVGMAAEGDEAIALLREAIAEGASLSNTNHDGHDPLRAAVEVCCPGKAPFVRELALLGCNPLEGALGWAVSEEDYEISEALIDVSLEKGYRGRDDKGVLDVLLLSLPIAGLDDLVRYALDRGAAAPAPEGKDWLMVLLGNQEAFGSNTDQTLDPIVRGQNQAAWRVFEVLLERGFMPTAVDDHGRNVIDLFNERMIQGSHEPENQTLIARFIERSLDDSTTSVDLPNPKLPRI